MEKFNKFFSYDEDEGKIVLHPPLMGSDSWSLRNADGFLVFGVDEFQEYEGVFLEDGYHFLNLVELDGYICFTIKFDVKGRKIIIEEITCRNHYKRSYLSVMPDRGMYIL